MALRKTDREVNPAIAAYLADDLEAVRATGIFDARRAHGPLFWPAITYALVVLHDLLQWLDRRGARVSLTDDVAPAPKVTDLTDLIAAARAAACHITSDRHYLGESMLSRALIVGSNQAMIGGRIVGTGHADDLLIQWGEIQLLLKRNLLRAIDLAQAGIKAS